MNQNSTTSTPALTFSEIVEVLRRNKGSFKRVARAANVRPSNVSHWAVGDAASANIAQAADAEARALLESEKAKEKDLPSLGKVVSHPGRTIIQS